MIIGTGIDIIEVDRIQKSIDNGGEEFIKRIFNDEEIEYANKHKYPTQHYAARFAAKEAIYKAFGDKTSLSWKDMTILNDKHGKPYCRLNKPEIKNKIFLSISHTKNYAVAHAIITP